MKWKRKAVMNLFVITMLVMQLLPVPVIAEMVLSAESSQTEVLSEPVIPVTQMSQLELTAYKETLTEEEWQAVLAALTPTEREGILTLLTPAEEPQEPVADLPVKGSSDSSDETETSDEAATQTINSSKSEEGTESSTTSSEPELPSEEETSESLAPLTGEDAPYFGAARTLTAVGPLVSQLAQEPEGNLNLKKTATYNAETGKVDFQLEAYAKGAIVTQSSPTDAVLVLDRSGSMDQNIGDVKKMAALKTAVNNFAATLFAQQSQLASGQYHTIRFVTFNASSSSNGVTYRTDRPADLANLQRAINNISASGGTRHNEGMIGGESIVASNRATANQALILFTDGVPDSTGITNSEIAAGAVNSALRLKRDKQTTVYSVGIQNNANPAITSSSDIPNSMLNGISSNYPSARVARDTQYTRDLALGPRAAGNYYLTTQNASELNTIFQNIATEIGRIENMEIRDVLTEPFNLPAFGAGTDMSSVKIYQAWEYNGSLRENTEIKVAFSRDSKSLSISELNLAPVIFDSNGQPTAASKNNKLIIRFSADVDPDFMGGNRILTNQPSSGAYGTNKDGSQSLLGAFEQPTVNIPLKLGQMTVKNQGIYVGNQTEIGQFFTDLSMINGRNNSHVNITYQIKKDGQLLAETTILAGSAFVDEPVVATSGEREDVVYQVTMTVTPALEPAPGTTGVADLSDTREASVGVFYPVVKAADRYLYLTNTLDLTSTLPTITRWEHRGSAPVTPADLSGVVPTVKAAGFALPQTLTANKEAASLTSLTLSNNQQLAQAALSTYSDQLDFSIYVFKPEIESSNLTIDLGMSATLSQRHQETRWRNPETSVTAIEGTAPSITLVAYAVETNEKLGSQVTPKVTSNYRWQVLIKEQDITAETAFLNHDYATGEQPAETHFTIFVETAQLTLTKTLITSGPFTVKEESFIFKIYLDRPGFEKTYYEVITLKDGATTGSVVLTGLEPGHYIVTELTDWSSRYDPLMKQQELNITDKTSLTFSNLRERNNWLSDESKVSNIFDPVSQPD